MVAQANEKVEGYTLQNIHLEYETIENEELAKRVNEGHEVGRSLSYEHTTLFKTTVWAKNYGTRSNESIDVPRVSMRAIVLLFRKRTVTDSEEYVFPSIEKVKVTIEGKPSAVYSQGLTLENFYDEAKRLLGIANNTCNDNISIRKFYKDKFALVVDLRAVDDSHIVGS
jgi:predicted AAA+ superfamily ATPase